jgi:hypothetical protein
LSGFGMFDLYGLLKARYQQFQYRKQFPVDTMNLVSQLSQFSRFESVLSAEVFDPDRFWKIATKHMLKRSFEISQMSKTGTHVKPSERDRAIKKFELEVHAWVEMQKSIVNYNKKFSEKILWIL